MSNIINVVPDEDGRIIIELYGKQIEIDDSMFDKKGVAKIKQFGQEYEVIRPTTKTKAKKVEAAEEATESAETEEE